MLNILLCPDKFRGSLSAPEACRAMTEGIRAAIPDAYIRSLPLSDGGEGFLETLTEALGGAIQHWTASDPLGRPILAEAGIAGEVAVIEMARASGLALLAPDERSAGQTTTYGTGELIREAVSRGATHLMLGIGGSATTDGGIGMAAALGWRFLDADGQDLHPSGSSLRKIATILPPEEDLLKGIRVTVASDVTAPLDGPDGAACVYGPQKGASPEDVADLDAGLAHLADVVRDTLPQDYRLFPGAGAAGGLGYGLLTFCGAELRPGADLVMELLGFDDLLPDADLILTGEGKLDTQSLQGKLIGRICERAAKSEIPVLALCGTLDADPVALRELGLSYAASILRRPASLDQALASAYDALKEAAFWTAELYRTASRKTKVY